MFRLRGLLHPFWAGQVPLGRAFWLYFILGHLIASLTTVLLYRAIFFAVVRVSVDPGLRMLVWGAFLVVLSPLLLAYVFICLVGVWRSANAHYISFEGAVAKVVVLLIAVVDVIFGLLSVFLYLISWR